jgi:hypothetical protein
VAKLPSDIIYRSMVEVRAGVLCLCSRGLRGRAAAPQGRMHSQPNCLQSTITRTHRSSCQPETWQASV